MLVLLLAGCGAGRDEVGDARPVEPAFVDGVTSVVRVPGGELRFRVGSPTDEPRPGIAQALDDEDGEVGTVLPVAWSAVADPDGTQVLPAALEEVSVVAVVDGERVPLDGEDPDAGEPDPASGAYAIEVPEAYDAADLRLEVILDDATQVLSPWSGEVDPGDAARLYDDAPASWRPPTCRALPAVAPLAFDLGLRCDTRTVVTSAWQPGLGWAPEDRRWWLVPVGTSAGAVDAVLAEGSGVTDRAGERWRVGAIDEHAVTLDGEAPVEVRPTYQGATGAVASPSLTGAVYVFVGPGRPPATAADAEVRVTQSYALPAGGTDPPSEQVQVDAVVPIGPAVPLAPVDGPGEEAEQ